KRTDQHTAELREDRIEPFNALQRQAARWAADLLDGLRGVDPPVPALNDRARQNWRPLLATAQIIGRDWPEKAMAAAVAMSGPSDTTRTAVVCCCCGIAGKTSKRPVASSFSLRSFLNRAPAPTFSGRSDMSFSFGQYTKHWAGCDATNVLLSRPTPLS